MKLKQIRVDGYKNLINCVVNFGDFNVLVGPNNSGKSNLLEAVQILWPLCFGDEKVRNNIFKGLTPRLKSDSSICHLDAYKNRPMKIGITFETQVEEKTWHVDYELVVKCDNTEKGEGYFVSENLIAKIPSNTGPYKKYIERSETNLTVCGRDWPIAKNNTSMLAIASLYPEYKELPPELKHFVNIIESISLTRVFSLSPQSLRNDIDAEKPIRKIQVSSFDLGLVVDNIKKNEKYYKLFRDSLCDILNLDDIRLEAMDVPIPSKEDKEKSSRKKIRFLLIKRRGSDFAFIEEYSDGTFVTAAILSVLFSEDVRGPILFIEEPENYLHPAALERLIRFLQNHADKWPVLITTHSPFLLNGVNPEDVNVAIVADDGSAHFEKITDRRKINAILNNKYMSFGDELVNNFEELLKTKKD
jgi:predicted ATPase